ncbi:hypothetical protein D9613_008438 [Agrocybe pediades]|uniref:SWR1-complex protein 5 n=1 Tax=Agrocybe pediades TaxID=84607 RepID=A0A8H4QTA7_9AGAR|nr:hypothetical protein D9613_008438 [Agrocybe pediades]
MLPEDRPQNPDSDEEDDDYVPPEKEESDSEPSETEDNNAGPVVDESAEDEESRKRHASVAAPPSTSPPKPKETLVKVEKRYLFAGKEVIEVVEVPENSADAKKWPRWKDPATNTGDGPDCGPKSSSESLATNEVKESPVAPIISTPPDNTTTTPVDNDAQRSSTPKPAPRKPGPRKSKVSLAPLPGSSKAKKLTTLDKSAMDWRNHIQSQQQSGSSDAVDELEANRRSGGYLEKVEFLKRVEERREDNLDAAKSMKRRKL